MASPVGVPLPLGVVAAMVPVMVAPSLAAIGTSGVLPSGPAQSLLPSLAASGKVLRPQEIELCVAVTICSMAGTTICHLVVVLPDGAPSGTSSIDPERSSTIRMSAFFGVGWNW